MTAFDLHKNNFFRVPYFQFIIFYDCMFCNLKVESLKLAADNG